MKNVLVLGANGFIGRHLIDKLLLKTKVVGYDRVMPDAKVDYTFICAGGAPTLRALAFKILGY